MHEQITRPALRISIKLPGAAHVCTLRPAAGYAWRRRRPRQLQNAASVVLQRDAQLQHAFQQSRRIGDQLLKDEAEEMRKIDELADDLLQREQRSAGLHPCHT